jgi:hypothetical protein
VHIGDYRQKQNLVILVTGEAGFGLLSGLVKTLSERFAEFRAETAEILVVVQQSDGSQAKLQNGLPFPVVIRGLENKTPIADPVRLTTPSVYVLDCYGEIYAAFQPDSKAAVPEADDLLDWLRFIELQCPE